MNSIIRRRVSGGQLWPQIGELGSPGFIGATNIDLESRTKNRNARVLSESGFTLYSLSSALLEVQESALAGLMPVNWVPLDLQG